MATSLGRFSDAYATMTVATYEPLILRWISGFTLFQLSHLLARRAVKAKAVGYEVGTTTAIAMSRSFRRQLPAKIDAGRQQVEQAPPVTRVGAPVLKLDAPNVRVEGFPLATLANGVVQLAGLTQFDPTGMVLSPEQRPGWRLGAPNERAANLAPHLRATPVTVNGISAQLSAGDLGAMQTQLFDRMTEAARRHAADRAERLGELLREHLRIDGTALPFFGGITIEEQLSPIGIAHYFRQLYFHVEEGVGPIEQAFTIAPLETLEVMYQSVRRQTHEEILEHGLEVVSDTAVEEKNLDEVSDKVSSMIQTDTSAAMSASASGGVGVWNVSASASADFSVSSQNAREFSSKRLKEVTTRASERITKSFTIKTRDVSEITETSMTRRTIRNDGPDPVSYALRRVLRKVRVKVQDLGPRLVWQTYLRNPGDGLALSRFVHFREAGPIAVPDLPPGVPPRPSGGVDTGSVQTTIGWNGAVGHYFVAVTVQAGPDRQVESVRIDSISDLEGGGKEDRSPSPINEVSTQSPTWDPATGTFTAYIAVLPGDSQAVQVNYSYRWEPSAAVIQAWEAQRAAAQAEITAEALARQFDEAKALITQRSKIKARPANALRREERYEVMNRLVSHLFARGDDPSEPTPLEIEYFHRYFDIEAIFTWLHPSWWKPRFSGATVGLRRPAYEITAESEPAPLGASLGWMLQEDGDDRRNEFLNSPWIRVCMPMRPGREREAIRWLAQHVEGEIGYDVNVDPLRSLIAAIDARRAAEGALGQEGPDYVKVDSTPGAPADPATPAGVYPIVDEFDVTVPTDGFVYDRLTVVT